MTDATITLPLTPAKIGRAVEYIVEQTFPRPRQELCIPVGEMERRLTAYAGEVVQAAYTDADREKARLRAESGRLARELADTQEHLRMDRESVATLRDREQHAWRHANENRGELERYRTEARQASEDAGRRMRLIVQLYDALCEAPRTPKVESALNAVDAEARRSPWMAERVGTVVEVQVADRG